MFQKKFKTYVQQKVEGYVRSYFAAHPEVKLIVVRFGILEIKVRGRSLFINPAVAFDPALQNIVLILNTVMLIAALVIVELIYSDMPKEKRGYLRLFYPFVYICISILLFAVYTQIRGPGR